MLATIDRASPLPLYYQLKQILLGKIEGGEWTPGDLIPSEHELQDQYGVSRTTVRQTLSDLVHEGFLVRQRGRGTFVAQAKISHDPGTGVAFSENLLRQGRTPSWALLERGWMQAPRHVRDVLESERVYRMRWLFSADDIPIGHHIVYIPATVVSEFEAEALSDTDWLAQLRQMPLVAGRQVRRTIEAVKAEATEVAMLGVAPGAPMLRIDLAVCDVDGAPLELLEACFDGDRFKYQITI
jgi:GntR family transcriptional regulator